MALPELEVVEGCNGFYLYCNRIGRGMGDGVDVEFLDENEDVISVGEEGFLEAWQKDVLDSPLMYIEAYFPEFLPGAQPACPACGEKNSWYNVWVGDWQCPDCETIHGEVEVQA